MLTKSCRHARSFYLVSQRSLASIINKNSTILTKQLHVATTVASGTQRHHCGIGTSGIPSDLRFMPEQSHHLPRALLAGDYRRFIESLFGVPTLNSTEKALKFIIYLFII